MTRTSEEMRAIVSELARELDEHVDRHPNLGCVLVLYELDAVASGENTNVSWAATKNAHVLPVLRAVLEVYEGGMILEVRGKGEN